MRLICNGFIGLLLGLVEYTQDESIRVYVVMDQSLVHQPGLSVRERNTLQRWVRDGCVESLPFADPRILEVADATELCVISDDFYKDAYRTYPWIAGSRDRFFQAVPGPAGTVKVVPRIMPTPPDWVLSDREERTELKSAGLYDRYGFSGVRTDLLSRLWRCPDDGCPEFGTDRLDDQPLPVLVRQDPANVSGHRNSSSPQASPA